MRYVSTTTAPAGTTLSRWPQYRKFSSISGPRELAKTLLTGGAVALAFFVSLRPDADSQQPVMQHATRHVTLERVVIAARRERPDAPVMTDSLRTTSTANRQAKQGSSAVKVIASRRD